MRFKAKATIQRGRKANYELGDKCSKLLAGKLKEKNRSVYVPLIKGKEGQLLKKPREIAQVFGEYYAALYNLPIEGDKQVEIEEYLSGAGMPRLPSLVRKKLESPITVEEVGEVLKKVKIGKSPGPDGFSCKERIHQHLISHGASLHVLRASFDLGDPRDKWADFLLQFLDSVYCGELQELDWACFETLNFYPPVGIAQAKTDLFNGFQTLLERLIRSSPKLSHMKLPFDWSEHSVSLLRNFQHLNTLELNYFWVFKIKPETMQELIRLLLKTEDFGLTSSGPGEGIGSLLPHRIQVLGGFRRFSEPWAGV
ncbi:uncharacterized protein LOC120941374 [Rana temporaria]|uniref:uncharacterized protein LOC120941374 n=1 Tax=Rana temporaria TaxID=8407 RepID=UPI001AACFC4D|nr:uncharacterized protein LOC120941374 [Rana temporaria]